MGFRVGDVEVSQDGPLFLIAGPCVLEDEAHALTLGREIARVAADAGVPLIFKASYDKANRSALDSYRGPGLEDGCRILVAVKEATGRPVLTDVHDPAQARRAAELGVDVLQIPAFLCRQTDLLVAAGEAAAAHGAAVNVKKGQFLAPGAMAHALEKVRRSGCDRVMVTERGTSFGYSLVNDMTAIPTMAALGAPVVFDGTHSVQRPIVDGAQGVTGGAREMIPTLVRAAVAAGCHGVFCEVHEEPARAPSDGTNMLPVDELPALLAQITAIRAALASAAAAAEA